VARGRCGDDAVIRLRRHRAGTMPARIAPTGEDHTHEREDANMLYIIAVVLLVLWALGFVVLHVGGGLIHILLVIALIMVVFNLVSGRRAGV
jgi:hypothetical protein